MKAKIGRRLTDEETKKAAVLAAYIDGSPHEWPEAVSEVTLVCHGYLDQQARIRELEAELAVRDNSANEVLRILREATGKRDFHSELEAAEWAAKMLADARLDSARLDHVIDNFELINIDGWADYADFSAIDLGPEEKEKDEIRKAWRKYLDAEIKEAK